MYFSSNPYPSNPQTQNQMKLNDTQIDALVQLKLAKVGKQRKKEVANAKKLPYIKNKATKYAHLMGQIDTRDFYVLFGRNCKMFTKNEMITKLAQEHV